MITRKSKTETTVNVKENNETLPLQSKQTQQRKILPETNLENTKSELRTTRGHPLLATPCYAGHKWTRKNCPYCRGQLNLFQ